MANGAKGARSFDTGLPGRLLRRLAATRVVQTLRHSFRLRLVLWQTLLLGIILAACGIALIWTVRGGLFSAIDRDLASRAQGAASFLASKGSERPTLRPKRDSRPQGYYRRPRAFDLSGNPLVHSEDRPWDVEALLAAGLGGRTVLSTTTDQSEVIRVASTALRDNATGERWGVVQVAYPLTDANKLISVLSGFLITMIPIGLIIAAAGGFFLTGRALAPVAEMTRAAAEIGAHDLSRRLPVRSEDELGNLAATFNGMVSRLQEAFARLDRAYQEQRRFIDDASHELRTPLTSIKANTSLALLGDPDLEEYALALRSVDHAADTMQRIVEDLLLLARSDSGRLQIEMENLSVASLFERVAESSGSRRDERCRFHTPSPDLAVRGDSHHLERLLTNLLTNARRHTPEDGKIDIRAAADGGSVVIQVIDNGEGISPEHMPHIFDRFYRVDGARTRATGGAGLGLSICRSIVEVHRGSIHLESAPGEGTRVTVRLPAGSAGESAGGDQPAAEYRGIPASRGGQGRGPRPSR